MTAHPPFRKVLDGVATREQMFHLFSRHQDTPGMDPNSGTPYSAERFEINASEYHFVLDLLPPLFMRTGMFGMSEYKAGNVTSIFFAIRIWGRERWFSWLLRSPGSAVPRQDARRHHRPRDRRERQHDPRGKARCDLEHNPCRAQEGPPRNTDPETGWAEHQSKRTVLVDAGRHDAAFKLLDDLSELEIDEFLSKVRLRRS